MHVNSAARRHAVRLHGDVRWLLYLCEHHVQCERCLHRSNANGEPWLEVIRSEDFHRLEAWSALRDLVGRHEVRPDGLDGRIDCLLALEVHRLRLRYSVLFQYFIDLP